MKLLSLSVLIALASSLYGQNTAASQAKPAEHVIGTVVAVDSSNHAITVKEDGAAANTHAIDLSGTRTLLKVSPTAKDLKGATRITSADLAIGDRVDVRGSKSDADPTGISARSVVLMSGRDLEQHHQAEADAWKKSTPGVVASVDANTHKLAVTSRTPEGPKPLTVDASTAQFVRYSPETPKSPKPSSFDEIQSGDQVKIIGEKSSDGSLLTAQTIYSGTFKTVAGTLVSSAPDGKSIVVKDLTSKQPVTVLLSSDSAIKKLPPFVAMMLARRFNPDYKAPEAGAGNAAAGAGGGGSGGPPAMGVKAGEAANPQGGAAGAGPGPGGWNRNGAGPGDGPGRPGMGGPGGGGMRGNGDVGQMIERMPPITLAELKPGDALVLYGSPSPANKSALLASNVIAGVEPILQSASPRQVQSLGDWGNSLGGGAMDTGGGIP